MNKGITLHSTNPRPRLSRFFALVGNGFFAPTDIAPLVVFRLIFGALTFFSTARFMYLGWVENHFIEPVFHFKYFGFHWVGPLPPTGMHVVHYLMLLASFLIVVGAFYRWATLAFFLLFTYCELIDLTYYLNHYYFVSVVAFLMVWVPADRSFALRTWLNPSDKLTQVPFWCIGIFKWQLAVVYIFAGLAKINTDWLIHALPLKIWLPSHDHLPVIGPLFRWEITPYLFSWFGMLYDSTIPLFLAWRKTRIVAYLAVIGFHAMTGTLFQIGVFPIVMIFLTLIYFPASFHQKIIGLLRKFLPKHPKSNGKALTKKTTFYHGNKRKMVASLLFLFFSFQLLFPWRYLLYDGNLFWNEEGYRFSWRVMLVEKAGTVFFHVTDPKTGSSVTVNNSDYLNNHQEKQMSFQPDMILQFAHFLEKEYQQKGFETVEIRAEAWVTMNGRPSKLLVDPAVDLTGAKEGWGQKNWVKQIGK